MRKLTDKQVEEFIGQVLRAGTLLSSAVTAIGISLYLLHNGATLPNYRVFHASHGKLLSFHHLLANAVHGEPFAIIQLGILLLIATPVARVAFLVGVFAMERDRMYVAVSGVVLAVLLYSLFFLG